MEALILRYELKGKARTCHDIFRLVLGPCVQCCSCKASEQKLCQKPKSIPIGDSDKALNVSSIIFSRKTSNLKKKNIKIG